MSNIYLALSVVGLAVLTAGIGLNWGTGWALMVCGAVLFLAGGVGSAREGR